VRDMLYENIVIAKGYPSLDDMLIKHYLHEKKSIKFCADILGVSPMTMASIMRSHEIPIRPRPKLPSIAAKYVRDMSIKELADHFHISAASAWRLKRKHALIRKSALPKPKTSRGRDL
jgi:hypothetical protein